MAHQQQPLKMASTALARIGKRASAACGVALAACRGGISGEGENGARWNGNNNAVIMANNGIACNRRQRQLKRRNAQQRRHQQSNAWRRRRSWRQTA